MNQLEIMNHCLISFNLYNFENSYYQMYGSKSIIQGSFYHNSDYLLCLITLINLVLLLICLFSLYFLSDLIEINQGPSFFILFIVVSFILLKNNSLYSLILPCFHHIGICLFLCNIENFLCLHYCKNLINFFIESSFFYLHIDLMMRIFN